jgi:hypothetical protein
MSRELLREAPGEVAAPPLAPVTAMEKLTGWLRGLRFRQVLSIPVWLAAFGLVLVGDVIPQLMPLSQFKDSGRGGNLADLVGVLLMVLAARLGASTASQLRALQPGRRPVLYLRSFKADKSPVSTSADEELLSRVFRTIGPFVAFEEPGERLPDLGSAKMSAAFSDWQEHVSDQIRQAELVVLNVGSTPSFVWEVKRALELADPERVLISFSMHADQDQLGSMYRGFVEAAQELVPHPFPPESEIGTQRFIRFDADRRPELFGSIERPRTTWRKIIGVLSLGMGLVVLRPIVAERWRHRLSTALAPLRARYDPEMSTRRVWGRLTVAVGIYAGGLAAFLPMMAWNAWRLPDRRVRYAPLAFTPLLLIAPVNEVIGFFSIIFAVVTYLAWPLLAPAAVRRHIVLGGPVFGFGAAAILVIAAAGVSIALPRGISQRIGSLEQGALLDVDELRAVLPFSVATVGANPSNVTSRKRSSLDGTFDLTSRYDAPDLSFSMSLTVLDPLILNFVENFGEPFPGFIARHTGEAAHDGWSIEGYDLFVNEQPSGVGLSAKRGSRRYALVISGLTMPLDDLVAIMRPRLDSAALVSGLFPRLGY